MNPDLAEAVAALRDMSIEVPRPPRLPTAAELAAIEHDFSLTIPEDLRHYLLTSSDIVYGTKELVTIDGGHTRLRTVLGDARSVGLPEELIPFCEDNGDFYCMTPGGTIVYWAHDGATDETWPSLASWIRRVWIAES